MKIAKYTQTIEKILKFDPAVHKVSGLKWRKYNYVVNQLTKAK